MSGQLSALLFLLFLVFVGLSPEVQGNKVRVNGGKPVTAQVGDDVLLPCRCEPAVDLTPLTVAWIRYSNHHDLVHAYKGQRDYLDLQYFAFRERTQLFHDQLSAGNASLKLRHLAQDDGGLYGCIIQNQRARRNLGRAYVTVKVHPSDERNVVYPEPKDQYKHTSLLFFAFVLLGLVLVFAIVYEFKRCIGPNFVALEPAKEPGVTVLDDSKAQAADVADISLRGL